MYANYEQLGVQPEPNRDIMDVTEIENTQHKRHIIGTNQVVCVDIYADWCGPCKQTAPDYALVAKTYSNPGQCAIVKQKLDTLEPDERSRVTGIPVYNFYLNGKQVDQVIGADIALVEVKIKDLLQKTQNRPPVQSQSFENNIVGPQHSRNTIRNSKSQMPVMESGQPYRPDAGAYHQPYGGR